MRFFATSEDPGGHHPLSQYHDRYAGYFRFAFVRNPWDRLVSAYFYLAAGGGNAADREDSGSVYHPYRGSFSAFVSRLDTVLHLDHFRPQCHWLCDVEGHLLTNYLGRFEHFEKSCRKVGTALGLPEREVPRINASPYGDYRAYFDSDAAAAVAAAYRQDIDLLGYGFDQPPPEPTAPDPLRKGWSWTRAIERWRIGAR